MLRIRNLDAGYGKLRVLKNISLHVDGGEIVTMIGANGAGKTTLLHTIAGLVRPTRRGDRLPRPGLPALAAQKIVATRLLPGARRAGRSLPP